MVDLWVMESFGFPPGETSYIILSYPAYDTKVTTAPCRISRSHCSDTEDADAVHNYWGSSLVENVGSRKVTVPTINVNKLVMEAWQANRRPST